MFRKLALTGLVAAAIAATPIAAPQARAADPHDIIGGALVLGVIGAIIANENRKRDERQPVEAILPLNHGARPAQSDFS